MANKPNIGSTITLDGEREYKRALSDINAGLKVNYSQMALTSTQYEVNGKSQEALRAKTDALRLAMYSQEEKCATLRGALANAVAKHGEASKAAMGYQVSLNKADAELLKMNGTMQGYETALTKSNAGTTSLADVTRGLADMFGVTLPPAAQAVVSKLDSVSASGAAFVAVIAGVVTGLAKMTVEAAHNADELLTLSSTTGLSTTALQEYKYASDFLDVSTETMTGALTKMIKSMDAARDGTKEAAGAYEQLHVKIKDGHGALRDANTVFYETIDALGRVTNETERDSLAMTVFGKSARELNPLIEAGSARLKELGVEAQNMGYVIDNDTLQSFSALQDSFDKMDRQTEALKNSFAVALLPILTTLFSVLSSIPVPVLQTVVVLATAVTGIILAVKAIREMTSTANAITGFFGGFSAAGLKTTAIVLGVVAALVVLGIIISVLVGRQNELNMAMSNVGNTVGNITGAANQRPNTKYSYATGTDNHPGGFARVGERGPEDIWMPSGSKVWPNGHTEGGVQNYYNVTCNARDIKELNDIIAICENKKTSMRQGVVTT